MKRKLYQYSLYLFVFSLSFFEDWSSKALIIVSILSLFNIEKQKRKFVAFYFNLIVFLSFYVVLNTIFIAQAFDTHIFSLLGLLILFFFFNNYTKIDKETYLKIPIAFAIGVFVVGILNLFSALIQLDFGSFKKLYNSWNTYAFINIHKIYYALFLCLSYSFVMDYLRSKEVKHKTAYTGFIVVFCICMLYYIGSVNGFLLFLLSNLFVVFSFFKNKVRSGLSIFVLILPLIVMLALSIPQIQKGFAMVDGEGSRMRNYNINKELFVDAPVFGYGIGKEKEIMQAKRDPRGWEYKNQYNAHNQYFESLIGGGLVIIILILSLVALLGYKAILNEFDYSALCFCAFILFSFIIESILERHHGIFFFSFFLSFFLFRLNE